MDTKLTLSFNEDIIQRAKALAKEHNVSLSRFIELLLDKATAKPYKNLEDLPVSDWVNMVSEGKAEYSTAKSRKKMKDEFFSSKK